MNDANPRQQIVDSIKNNSNILVTVSTSPSVDELSAALGLTILLNNLSKRATAVVSGKIPAAITFLDPEKTFEDTVNSLRDFIIALDKEKADHLRYKVDGDVVKIFITPYRTTLSEKDLEFSQGDYNVELVIALGVKDKDHLDKALDAHGRILHDATVATITAGSEASTLGSIAWQDTSASCLSEMLVSLTEALKEDKTILDEQIATAFLTGIVSATDRFSNNLTSSRLMTMAAQLMAAGANQQLIAAKLEEAHDIKPETPSISASDQTHADGTTSLTEGEGTKLGGNRKKSKKDKKPTDGIDIAHDKERSKEKESKDEKQQQEPESSKEEPSSPAEPPAPADVPTPESPAADTSEDVEAKLAAELDQIAPPETPAPNLEQQLDQAKGEQSAPEAPMPPLPPLPPLDAAPPAPEAAPAPVFDFESLLPKTTPQSPVSPEDQASPPVPAFEPITAPTADISSTHDNGYVSGDTQLAPPLNGIESDTEPASVVDPFSKPLISPSLPPLQPDPLFDSQHSESVPATAATIQPPTDTSIMPDFEETPLPNDPAAVAAVPDFAAMNPTGLAPDSAPTSSLPSLDSIPPPPPLPDFSSLPPLPPVPNLDPIAPPAPQAPESLEEMFPPQQGQAIPAPATPPAPSAPTPPGQFKIPGQ